MKRQLIYLLFLFALVVSSYGQTVTIQLNYTLPNDNEEPESTHRIPPRPITVTIDFEANELTFTPQLEEIDSYEIWDEGEERLTSVSYDSIDFINNLSSANGNVVIVINTPDRSYKGYFSISNPN